MSISLIFALIAFSSVNLAMASDGDKPADNIFQFPSPQRESPAEVENFVYPRLHIDHAITGERQPLFDYELKRLIAQLAALNVPRPPPLIFDDIEKMNPMARKMYSQAFEHATDIFKLGVFGNDILAAHRYALDILARRKDPAAVAYELGVFKMLQFYLSAPLDRRGLGLPADEATLEAMAFSSVLLPTSQDGRHLEDGLEKCYLSAVDFIKKIVNERGYLDFPKLAEQHAVMNLVRFTDGEVVSVCVPYQMGYTPAFKFARQTNPSVGLGLSLAEAHSRANAMSRTGSGLFVKLQIRAYKKIFAKLNTPRDRGGLGLDAGTARARAWAWVFAAKDPRPFEVKQRLQYFEHQRRLEQFATNSVSESGLGLDLETARTLVEFWDSKHPLPYVSEHVLTAYKMAFATYVKSLKDPPNLIRARDWALARIAGPDGLHRSVILLQESSFAQELANALNTPAEEMPAPHLNHEIKPAARKSNLARRFVRCVLDLIN